MLLHTMEEAAEKVELDPKKCRHIMRDGRQCGIYPGEDKEYCLWHDDKRLAEAAAARSLGGVLGGRKRKYVKGTPVPIESLDDVLKGLGETIANLREMDATPTVCNSLINAYRVAAACFTEQQDRDVIMEQIEELEAAIEGQ